MAKFTITINDTQIEKFILNMLSLLKNKPGVEFIKEGNDYVITSKDPKQNLMLAGKPLSWEELVSDIETSESEYAKGNYLTSKDLRNEAGNW